MTAESDCPERPVVRRVEIDGVPTFWLPVSGPLRVGLAFRVGQAHETLSTRGITHLVEHLALESLQERDHQKNGFVDEQRTVFWASGDETEMVTYLGDVTTALSDLPGDRVESERRILSVEAMRHGPSLSAPMLTWRYGATGLGLLGYNELGLRWLEQPHVQSWSSRMFTRQNAVLWLTGEPPAGLRLHLTDGQRGGWPMSKPAPVPVPTCLRQDGRLTGLGLVVARNLQTAALIRIAERRLQVRLRRDLGVAYEIGSGYLRIDEDHGHVVLAADSLPDQSGQVLNEILSVIEEFATHGPTTEEVDRDIELLKRAYRDESIGLAWLDSFAMSELMGEPEPRTPAEAIEITRGAASARSQWSEAVDGVVAVMNRQGEAPPWRFTIEAVWSTERMVGETFRSPTSTNDRLLVVGVDGVSLVVSEKRVATVRFDRCVACTWWSDGSRGLQGEDGFFISVKPWEWVNGSAAVAAIDGRVDPAVFVPMGEGTGPPSTSTGALPPAKTAGRRRVLVLGWFLWVMLSITGVLMMLTPPVTTVTDPRGEKYEALCGTRSSLAYVIDGIPTDLMSIDRKPCHAEAGRMMAAGVVGLPSMLLAIWVGIRSGNRWMAPRRDRLRRRIERRT